MHLLNKSLRVFRCVFEFIAELVEVLSAVNDKAAEGDDTGREADGNNACRCWIHLCGIGSRRLELSLEPDTSYKLPF